MISFKEIKKRVESRRLYFSLGYLFPSVITFLLICCPIYFLSLLGNISTLKNFNF